MHSRRLESVFLKVEWQLRTRINVRQLQVSATGVDGLPAWI